ncbi:MAG: GGDEF domain-containing protein [Pyrinomonadaceae bacterium]
MDSKIALIIQITGVILITVLTIFLRRSLRVVALKYWTYAWLSLSFSLICLRLAFSLEQHSDSLYSLYFFGEYLFGFLLIAGCRSLHGDDELKTPSVLLIIPLCFLAIGLPMLAKDFEAIYNIHSLVVSGFFLAAFLALRKSEIRSFGWRVMHVSVALLAADFLAFFFIFTARQFIAFPIDFLQFNSVVDLVLETALGFGMVIVILEKFLADFKSANERLEDAHKRLEDLVHTDPLTAAFNRHAFYGFMKTSGEDPTTISGCVGFFDIDGLKEINDNYGHPAGDQAIRAVVRGIREIIRAEDLIYRWGGDEFFVIMVSMDAEMANFRMQRLDTLLSGVRLEGLSEPIDIGVSCGFSDFEDSTKMEKAIKEADSEMYQRKQIRKQAWRVEYSSSVNENPQTIGL